MNQRDGVEGQGAAADAKGRAEIERFLCESVAELIEVAVDDVDVRARFSRFGLDSASALIVTDMLSEWLGLDLEPTLLYEYETIEQLATYLEGLR